MADGGPSRNSAVRGSGSRLDVAVVRHAETWRTARVTDAMLARAARAGVAAAAQHGREPMRSVSSSPTTPRCAR